MTSSEALIGGISESNFCAAVGDFIPCISTIVQDNGLGIRGKIYEQEAKLLG